MEAFAVAIQSVITDSGFLAFTTGNAIMILVGLILLYLAFAKEFEPLLLGPIAFGCVLANIPRNGFEEGVMALISAGISQEIFPPLIFLGVGAMTDFGPLIANPKTLLLGAAAQIGVLVFSPHTLEQWQWDSLTKRLQRFLSSVVLTVLHPFT
jgi:oxaloacetate decarboxylase beta subunit/glutaconyl-CoA decarboxylase